MGRKFGRGLRHLFGEGRAESPSNTKSPGLRPSSIPSGIFIHAAIWPLQIWAENQVGAVSLWGRGSWCSSNTMWPGPRPTCMPSFILIHPTVWPQCTNVTDRQDRQDRRSERTLQTVAQKTNLLTSTTVDCFIQYTYIRLIGSFPWENKKSI